MKNIKMIAVDMDGTFLDSNMAYNKERFMKQYQAMKEKGIRFVVASGNQYYQLISFFPEIKDEISFVAENGAYVVDQGKDLFNAEMNQSLVHTVLDVLSHYDDVLYITCGVKGAYMKQEVPQELYDDVNRYYHRLNYVEDLYAVEDTIFKFALLASPEVLPQLEKELNDKVGHLIHAVTSGHRAIDLIVPGVHKASGLKRLQEIYDIKDDQVAAFGDSNNDLEMLKHAHYSFAVENARDSVKEASKTIIGNHNDEAVLNTISDILR